MGRWKEELPETASKNWPSGTSDLCLYKGRTAVASPTASSRSCEVNGKEEDRRVTRVRCRSETNLLE